MADTHNLEQEIRDVLALTDAGAMADLSPLLVVTTWAEELAEAAHAVALEYESGEREQLKRAATQAALDIWDKVIVPQDIPQIPEMIELWVESSVRSFIPNIVASLFDRLPKPAVGPA